MQIQVNNLSKEYKGKKVFDGFNLDIDEGEIVGIRGRTGTGKTTLKRCITGLEDFEGEISVGGEISYLFQDSRLFPWLNVWKNLVMPFRLQGKQLTDERIRRVEKLAEEFGVQEHLDKKVEDVSGGQKQRILQVRALVNDPEILLLDEPFKSLDRESRRESYERLVEICRENGITVLVASHQDDIEDFVDRLVDFEEERGVAN